MGRWGYEAMAARVDDPVETSVLHAVDKLDEAEVFLTRPGDPVHPLDVSEPADQLVEVAVGDPAQQDVELVMVQGALHLRLESSYVD